MRSEEVRLDVSVLPLRLVYGGVVQLILSIILCVAVVSCILTLLALLSFNYVDMSNVKNVVYQDNSTGTELSEPTLLIPQFDAYMGMVYFGVGATTFSRKIFNLIPIKPLNNAAEKIDPILPEGIREAYINVRSNALQLGYGLAENCGGRPSTSIASLSYLVIAAHIIGFVCTLVASVCACIFFVEYTRRIFFENTAKWSRFGRQIVLQCNAKNLQVIVKQLCKQRRREQNVLSALLVTSTLGMIFLIIALAVKESLINSIMKCGTNFCDTYIKAMQDLFDTLPPSGYRVKCSRGFSSRVFLVATILSAVTFVLTLAITIFVCGYKKRGSLQIDADDDMIDRPSSLGGPLGTMLSSLEHTGAVRNTLAGSLTEPSFSGRELASIGPKSAHPNIPFTVCIQKGHTDEQLKSDVSRTSNKMDTVDDPKTKSEEKVFKKQMKDMMDLEHSDRGAVRREEQLEFYSNFYSMKQNVWQVEVLGILHKSLLDWYFAPQLDLCVEETFYRQEICRFYCSRLDKKIRSLDKDISADQAHKNVKSALRLLRSEKYRAPLLGSASYYAHGNANCAFKVPTDTFLEVISLPKSKIRKSRRVPPLDGNILRPKFSPPPPPASLFDNSTGQLTSKTGRESSVLNLDRYNDGCSSPTEGKNIAVVNPLIARYKELISRASKPLIMQKNVFPTLEETICESLAKWGSLIGSSSTPASSVFSTASYAADGSHLA